MKRILTIGLAVSLLIALAGCPSPVVGPEPSSSAEMTSFVLPMALNLALDADYPGDWNAVAEQFNITDLPAGVDVRQLVPTFTVSTGATVKIGAAAQTSGVSVVDFTSDVVYTVTAEDGTTKNEYTVHVTAPELGFSAFSIAVSGMPGGTMPLERDNTNNTLTGEIPYTYRTAKDSPLTISFDHNGTGVWLASAEQTSGISQLDFSTATGTSSYSLELRNVGSIAKTYTVTVTAATSASADADLSSFSVTSGTSTYPGTITGTEVSFARLPPYADINALTVNFAMSHVAATLADGATTLTSGTSTLDLNADKLLTATAEDGSTQTYTVKAVNNKPDAAIIAMDLDSYTDGMKYIDIKIYDKAGAGSLSMGYLTSTYENYYFPSLSALPFWASVADGDIIRVWDAFGTVKGSTNSVNIQDDVVKSDNTADRWDVRNAETTGPGYFLAGYNVVFLKGASGFVNIAPISTSSTWFSPVPPSFDGAVTAGYWNEETQPASIIHGSTATAKYARLLPGKTHGLSASDWEIRTDGKYFSFTAASATPSVNFGVGGTVTLSITPTMFNGAVASSVFADLTAIGGTANTNLTDTAGVWSTTFDVAPTLAAGTYSVPVDARDSVSGAASKTYTGNEIKVTVMPPKDISISSFTASPTIAPVNPASTVTLTVDVSGLNGDTVSTVSVDTSAINTVGPVALVNSSGTLWTATTAVDAGLAVGDKTLIATATSSSGIVKTASAVVTVSSDPTMTINSFTASKYLIENATADTVTLTADILGLNGANPDTVTADLSAFGGSASAAFTNVSGNTWTCDLNVPDTQAPAGYTITVTANNVANALTETASLNIRVRPVMAFANSDMEADMHNTGYGLKPTTSGYESVTGHDGTTSRALHVYGTNTSTAFIFTSAVPLNAQGTYTKISFWVKGAITGADKAISIQIGSLGSSAPGQIFPCEVIGAIDKTVVSASSHSYTGSLNTEGNWVKITLDLITGTATTTAGNTIAFKVGGATGLTCDFYIDDIVYEE